MKFLQKFPHRILETENPD